mgnify:CR=1 FL=1
MESKLIIYLSGNRYWKLPSGDLHRECGPAVEYISGHKEWWLNGIEYSEQEYIKKMRLKKLEHIL